MKTFITLKVGYTCGIYGCSNEFFNTIYVEGETIHSVQYYGMYGAEERINATLKEKGFTQFYVPSDFGKMTRKDAKGFVSEAQAIKQIETALEIL